MEKFSKIFVIFLTTAHLIGCAVNQNTSRNINVSQNNSLEKLCRAKYSSRLLAPTKTGNFFESYGAANQVYTNCMAGLPDPQNDKTKTEIIVVPEKQFPTHTTCMPNGVNIDCHSF